MEEIKNKPKKFEEPNFHDEIEKVSSRNWSSLDKMVAEFSDLKEKFKDKEEALEEINWEAIKVILQLFSSKEELDFLDYFYNEDLKEKIIKNLTQKMVFSVFNGDNNEEFLLEKQNIITEKLNFNEDEKLEIKEKVFEFFDDKGRVGEYSESLMKIIKEDEVEKIGNKLISQDIDKRMFNNIKEISKIFFANDKNKISDENRNKVINFLNNPNNIFNKGEIDSVRDVFDLKDSEIMSAIKKNIEEFGVKKNNRDSIIYNESTENNEFKKQRLEKFVEKLEKRIPEIVNKIKENKTDYVILAEKTARLFKVAFQRILKKYGIPAKVISFTPEYFEEEKNFGNNIEFQKNKKEKIDKLKKIFNNKEEDLKIMVVDEFYDLGRVKDKMFYGLMNLGIDSENIDYMEIENKNILEGNPVLETVYYEKSDIFKNDKEGVFHPVLKGEYKGLLRDDVLSTAVKYKKTSEDIWKIFDNIDESKFQ